MKKFFYLFANVLFILTAIILNLNLNKNNTKTNKLIGIVNGDKIYEDELQKRLATLTNESQQQIDINALPKDILESVVMEASLNKKINQAARRDGYQRKPEIRKMVKEYEDEIIREKYLNDAIYSKISESDLKSEYERIKKTIDGQEERKIKHILVENEDEIIRIRRSIERGQSFESMAIERSIDKGSAANGGDIGYVLKAELDPDFATIAFILKTGEVSKPVKTSFGWHLIKIEDVRLAQYLPFDEVKNNIKISLQQQSIRDHIKDLTKDLKVELISYEEK